MQLGQEELGAMAEVHNKLRKPRAASACRTEWPWPWGRLGTERESLTLESIVKGMIKKQSSLIVNHKS